MIRRATALVAALSLGALAAYAEGAIATDGLKASPTAVSIGTVTADKDGYVVVHRTDFTGTLPGSVIGHAPVKAGSNAEVSVPLDKQQEAGTRLIVMLHEEGDGDTDFDAADKPVRTNGTPVQETVTVE
ncbi:MAG: hypothetical protein AB7S70_07295 [Hyphomicrobium sp.]|uniref:DUF7282 domain-containing protein n=1 Tax=Hyphomicrobium sp. TaxID=82 RepID=UPI003D118960